MFSLVSAAFVLLCVRSTRVVLSAHDNDVRDHDGQYAADPDFLNIFLQVKGCGAAKKYKRRY